MFGTAVRKTNHKCSSATKPLESRGNTVGPSPITQVQRRDRFTTTEKETAVEIRKDKALFLHPCFEGELLYRSGSAHL